MKKTLIMALATLNFAFAGGLKTFEVTIQNLTKGQPLTPVVVVAHNKKVNLFSLGEEASQGLKELAEDGKTQVLVDSLADVASDVNTGTGLIMPGQTETITIKAKRRDVISLVSMLAKTNDAFIGVRNVSLRLRRNKSYKTLAAVYDAGTEENNELQAYIPAFGAAGVMTENSEGFIHPHTGLAGNGDLNLAVDNFSSKAALVTIKRVK